MRDLKFTIYSTAQDNTGKEFAKPWAEWQKILSSHSVRGLPSDTSSEAKLQVAKNGPAVLLGTVTGRRAKANVTAVHALSIDLDELSEKGILTIFEILKPFEWVAYTTHKHGSQIVKHPRLRIILPLDKPYPPTEHLRAWEGLDTLIGGHNDKMTKDASRLNFLPSTYNLDMAGTHKNEGSWITLADLPTEQAAQSPTESSTFDFDDNYERILKLVNTLSKEHPLKESARRLKKGEALASTGGRHACILSLTMWLAQRRPSLHRETLDLLFKRSIDQMPGKTLDEVWDAYEGGVVKCKENQRQTQLNGRAPYTDEELAHIAAIQKCEPDELRERWIIQIEGGGWVLNKDGHYLGQFSRHDLPHAIWRELRRAPVRLVEATANGFKYRTATELVREHGTLALKVLSDLGVTKSTFDASKSTMREAVCPVRSELAPKYDPEIDQWLKLFGGEYYSKLLDWLSVCTRMELLLCALYFDGTKGVGKTIFAHGVSSIWSEGAPTKLSQVVSGEFNEALLETPLIFADEKLPKKNKWEALTEDLREMVSTTSRELTRKYKAPSKLKGAIRLVLAANNEFLLESAQAYSRADQEAIAQRFLYIKAGDGAAKYLNKLGSEKKQHWVEQGIAEHTLWLVENHKIEKMGDRFAVEGDDSVMHRLLMTGSYWNTLVCEWLVRYLNNPEPINAQGHGFVRIVDGELLVNEQGLIDGWDIYLSKVRAAPETQKIGAALISLSKTKQRKQLRWKGKHFRYRYMDVQYLVDWSDRYNIGDMEQIQATLNPGQPKTKGKVLDFKRPDEPAVPDIAGEDDEGNIRY